MDNKSYHDKICKLRGDIVKYIIQNRTKFYNASNKKNYINPPDNYSIYIIREKPTFGNIDIGGITYLEGKDWIQITHNIKIASFNVIDKMYILIHDDWNKSVYHFIHEMAHTITLAESHKITKNTNLNTDEPYLKPVGNYLPCHHSISFYRNLAILLRIAKKINIWIPPKQFKGFDPILLQRFDKFTIF